ncbi:MAG: hypothetical protein JSV44_04190 [Candidatus Zixiibacteriota bacterium]|nr:MAG: hypothetical protein JSV44_04190 [candidate division Zixibacteria bacterium]
MVDPMGIADAISKTELVGKMKQKQKAASEMEQRQAISTVKQKITTDAERAKETIESDHVVISREPQEQREKKKDKRAKGRSMANTREDDDAAAGEHLDMTI